MNRRSPMPRIGDVSKSGLLVVTAVIPNVYGTKTPTQLVCRCRCGTVEVRMTEKQFKTQEKKSCGCLYFSAGGVCQTTEYLIWKAMQRRCYSVKDKRYKDYGGRGIVVCDRWRESFQNFLADMGLRPSTKHSIDRYPNNDGNYEPSNCRWATRAQQGGNKRNNILISLDGVTKTLAQWCVILELPYETIRTRIRDLGWDGTKAITTPIRAFKGQ